MKRQRSFTLVEILMVIGIIGLLSSLTLIIVREAKEKARITGLLNFSASIKHAFLVDIVGEWEFEDTPNDSSYNNLDGGWVGSSSYVPNDASSQLGKAAQFDGNNYVQVIDPGDESLLDIDNEITIELWIKISELGNKPWRCVVCKDKAYELRIKKDGRASFRLRGEDKSWYENEPSENIFKFETEKWYHYVGTWNGSEMKVFVNGEEKGEPVYFSESIDENEKNLVIGGDIIGIIDGVRLYNKSFTSAQIKKLYAEGINE